MGIDRTTEEAAPRENRNRYASPEELRYARVLQIGARVGLAMLIAIFALYVSGAIPPLVPLASLPQYWSLSAREFVAATHHPTGWAWLGRIGLADIAILAPIAFLAGVSVLCALAVLPRFLRRGDAIHAAILVLQIVVLVLAASNVLGTR
ncbi:MAG TPA: hypothetical protein VL742_09975 [Casimicrobiaceae bacterium]|nr:hypothetical protein [Casimicrobiaceae bacterium]